MAELDPRRFRTLCSSFATGVTVVSACDAAGLPAGLTVNSFTSVSLRPPLISVNIDREASLHGAIVGAAEFAVNVLRREQEPVSRLFAGEDRSVAPPTLWAPGPGGRCPILANTLATFWCRHHTAIPMGDHTILVGELIAGERHAEGDPLLFFQGRYHGADHR